MRDIFLLLLVTVCSRQEILGERPRLRDNMRINVCVEL